MGNCNILSGTDGMCRNGCIRWNQENCKSIWDRRSVHGGSVCSIGSHYHGDKYYRNSGSYCNNCKISIYRKRTGRWCNGKYDRSNAERYCQRNLLEWIRTWKRTDRSGCSTDQRTCKTGTGVNDRYIYWYDRNLYDDRTFYCHYRNMEYGTGRCGNYDSGLPEGTSVPAGCGILCIDDLSGIFCIYNDSWMGLLRRTMPGISV